MRSDVLVYQVDARHSILTSYDIVQPNCVAALLCTLYSALNHGAHFLPL